MKQFWMVLGSGEPKYRHESEQSATTEAERLARANPGKEFFVLEATAMRCVDSMVRVSLRPEFIDDEFEIPF